MTFGVRPLTVLTLLGIISAFLFCAGAQAAEGKVLVQQWGKCGPNWDMYRISIVGPIDDIMLAEFAKAAEDPRVKDTQKYTGPTVRLNSLGGSVSDAMAIGNIIRNAGYFTAVYEGDECSSACVLVLAGGVSRIASWGKIGIHRPHFTHQSVI
jgi:ATP-dependent protease ClpP protease subunit